LVFHLRESPLAREDLATRTVDAATLADNSYWSFTFPPITQAKGRAFYFFVESPVAQPGEAATLWYSEGDPYTGGTRTQDGSAVSGDLVFRTLSPASEGEPWFSLVVDGGATGASVYENRQVMPRAWLVYDAEVEPDPQARLKRLSESASEADARIYIAELNRLLDLHLPEDAGFETLGGFVTTLLGRIPPRETSFEHAGVKYTVLDAEPQKINRVRIEVPKVRSDNPASA
jgi:hypothetical protein